MEFSIGIFVMQLFWPILNESFKMSNSLKIVMFFTTICQCFNQNLKCSYSQPKTKFFVPNFYNNRHQL